MDISQFSAEFQAFLNMFAQNKGNQLQFSNTFMPKRVETVIIDLTTARDAGAPLEIKVPFNAVHVESIYTTASGAAVSGTVKISFDYGDIASISNAKTLSSNDSFTVDKEVSKAFITNSSQIGVSARISFMTDIDYRPGATQSVVTSGNIAITSTKYPQPTSATAYGYSAGAATGTLYTVPAGKYARISCSVMTLGAAQSQITLGGTGFLICASPATGNASATTSVIVPAGSVIGYNTTGAAFAAVTEILVEEYAI